MRIHYLQHVDFESPAAILDWAEKKNHKVTHTKYYLNESLPQISDFDLLIVMGGPMNIYDTANYSYLLDEKRFIKKVIDENKIVLGICLGAQLIADVLGAKVKPNEEKEIGWFPIYPVENNYDKKLNKIIAANKPVFHWHGDTFEIPKDAIRLAKSRVCENQAFVYKQKVFAFQYHLEMTKNSLQNLINKSRNELTNAPYIQSENEMLKDENHFEYINDKLFSLLDYIEKS